MFETEFFKASERPDLMALAWRLRYRVFKQSLKWQILTNDLLEFDEFDMSAVHCVITQNAKVVGYWRALRTDAAYLLEQSFPQFQTAYAFPRSKRIWEISRFAIDPEFPDRRQVGAQLARAFVEHGFRAGATEVIGITEPGFEAFLKRSGLTLHRAAGPLVVGKAGERDVIGVITVCPIDFQNIKAAGLVDALVA